MSEAVSSVAAEARPAATSWPTAGSMMPSGASRDAWLASSPNTLKPAQARRGRRAPRHASTDTQPGATVAPVHAICKGMAGVTCGFTWLSALWRASSP
jgi:hypothetical protein